MANATQRPPRKRDLDAWLAWHREHTIRKPAVEPEAPRATAERQIAVTHIPAIEPDRVARREWQNPSILERQSARGPEWYIRYRVRQLNRTTGKFERKEKWQALGLCAKMSKHAAEREKDRIMRQVNNQVFTIKSQIPFVQVLTRFRELHVGNLAAPSQATYKQHIRAYIEPAFSSLQLCEIGVVQIEELFRKMEQRGLSRYTRATTKGILKSIFGCAKKWGFLDAIPVKSAGIGGGPRAVRECRVPSLENVRQLMDACEGDVPLLIETLYTTGMRISEAAGLVVADLDFEAGRVNVRRRNCRRNIGDTKTDASRRVLGLGDAAVKLAGHVAGKSDTDPVFTWKGNPIVDNTLLANYLTPIMESLGIKFPGFGWHTFRRLHLTLMQRSGLSLLDLKRQAGHADVRTTQRYIVDDVARREEVAKTLPRLSLSK